MDDSIERDEPSSTRATAKSAGRKEDTDEVIALIEGHQPDKLACPDCKSTELYRWGNVSQLQRYRCRQCHRTFNALTGTPPARLRHKDKWFEYEQTLIQGLSIRQSADSCG
ncbi:MAG: IS1 family transposase [Burkholderiales bacterium]|nr:IS1 family transposase [Burkholderiales bacterium]